VEGSHVLEQYARSERIRIALVSLVTILAAIVGLAISAGMT
jgi:hypothetical protein